MARERPDYHVVAAVGRPEELTPLLAVSCGLARARGGRVTLLTVMPDGRPPAWLTPPETYLGVPVRVLSRLGHSAGGAILAALHEAPPDLLLLGWSGAPARGRNLLGSTIDPLIRKAPCDIAVLRLGGGTEQLSANIHKGLKRLLVLFGGGPNASLALQIALDLAPQASVTALTVAQTSHGAVGVRLGREQLSQALKPWANSSRVQPQVTQAPGIVGGILNEIKSGYDLVLIGASHESYLDRMLFGNVPQTIAAASPIPVIIAKRGEPPIPYLRRLWRRLFGAWPTLTVAERAEVYRAVRRGARPDIDFFIMMGLAAAIAALGLLLDSPAVIIGAMLVAPLMSAIIGLGLGVVQGDLRLLRLSIGATLRGALLAIAVGAMVGYIVPNATPTHEIAGRAHPNLLDLGVALISGLAGAYAVCRKDVSTALPGVAIAAALVPPLSTIGIGLALGSAEVTGGALLLFITNLTAISAAGGLIFMALGFRPALQVQTRARVFAGGVISVFLLLLAVTVPLGLLTLDSLRQAEQNRQIQNVLDQEVRALGPVELTSWKSVGRTTEAPETTPSYADALYLEVQVRAAVPLHRARVVELQRRIAARLQRPVALQLIVIPVTQLEPVVPPTPTPAGDDPS